jgi:hypothetical protein
MNKMIERIESLDLTLFDSIPSQTSTGDRRSLLGVQRAMARKYKEYTYLEIGSHLGGSIQPHLLDDRCRIIYSIDPRPSEQPDDRVPGCVAYYENNSSERMMTLLGNIGHGEIAKIRCIDLSAPEIDPRQIEQSPQLVLIDGEHTKAAVLSDFQFCSQVVSGDGTILFHDFAIIYPAIMKICRMLDQQRRTYLPLKLEDNVFAIFFDPNTVQSDQYLTSLFEKNRHFLLLFRLKVGLKRIILGPIRWTINTVRNLLRKSAE